MTEKKQSRCEELFDILAGIEMERANMGEQTLYGSANVRPGALEYLEMHRAPTIHAIKKCSGLKDDHEVYRKLAELRRKRQVHPNLAWEEHITDEMVNDYVNDTLGEGGGCGCKR